MAPKCKSGDAGNSDMPKESHTILPLCEKLEALDKKNKPLLGRGC
jgi:hypothetical protein